MPFQRMNEIKFLETQQKIIIMKKYITVLAMMCISGVLVHAQKYLTKEGEIKIFSQTSLFTIEATDHQVASILDAATGQVVASTLVRSFKFREALVEEHFNTNYMQSDKYPKAIFKGKITNFSSIDFTKDGTYDITIEGELTLHGQTRPLATPGKLTISGDKIHATTEFYVSLQNYKIHIEESYKDRIKDEIKLTVTFDYNKM